MLLLAYSLMPKVRVGVAGATGYGGQELLRLLARHPHAEVTAAMASSASEGVRALPALTGVWSGRVAPLALDELTAAADRIFLALPEAASAALVPDLLARGARVLDLSGAFRLRDAAARARWYPQTSEPECPVAYGLTERRRDALAAARIIACPGCYPTSALLALEPLSAAGLLAGDVVIDAKSGISGAGKTPSERTHFSERHGSVAAYGVFSHRHADEIEQELGRPVTFVPHLVPLDRGILTTIYTRVPAGTAADTLAAVFEQAYGAAPFVRLRGEALPEIRHVAHTNFCDVGWKLDAGSGRLVLVSCLDNLVKGAAGQAVQNFNVALGFDERAGLI